MRFTFLFRLWLDWWRQPFQNTIIRLLWIIMKIKYTSFMCHKQQICNWNIMSLLIAEDISQMLWAGDDPGAPSTFSLWVLYGVANATISQPATGTHIHALHGGHLELGPGCNGHAFFLTFSHSLVKGVLVVTFWGLKVLHSISYKDRIISQ